MYKTSHQRRSKVVSHESLNAEQVQDSMDREEEDKVVVAKSSTNIVADVNLRHLAARKKTRSTY